MVWVRKKGGEKSVEVTDQAKLDAIYANPDRYDISETPFMTTSVIGGQPKTVDLGTGVQRQPQKETSKLEALGLGGLYGSTFGTAPQIQGAFQTIADKILEARHPETAKHLPKRTLSENIAAEKEKFDVARAERPTDFAIGDIGSAMVPTPTGPLIRAAGAGYKALKGAQAAEKGLTAAEKIAQLGTRTPARNIVEGAGRASLHGGVEGGIQGFGRTEGGLGERLKGAAVGTGLGAVGGSLMGAGATGVAELARKGQAAPAWTSKFMTDVGDNPEATSAMNRLLATTPEGRIERELVDLGKRQGADITRAKDVVKRAIGPSPTEVADEAAMTRKKQIGGYTKELQRQQKESMQSAIRDDMNEMIALKDEIQEAANTGMKRDTARNEFATRMQNSKGKERAQMVVGQAKIYKKSKEIADGVDGMIQNVLKDDTYELAAKREAKVLKKKLDAYRARLNEIQQPGQQFGIDPDGLADTYIIVDNLKRDVGGFVKNVSKGTRADPSAAREFNVLYHEILPFLEDQALFGNMGKAQKEINKAWTKDIPVSGAVDAGLFVPRKLRTQRAADPFKIRAEFDVGKAQGLLDDPGSAKNAMSARNLKEWLENTPELADVLSKHYNPDPALRAKVERLRELSGKVKGQMSGFYNLAKEARDVGVKESDTIQKLLRSDVGKGQEGQRLSKLVQEEEASKVFDPNKVRELQKAEEAYSKDIEGKLGAIGPEYPALSRFQTLKKAESASTQPVWSPKSLAKAIPGVGVEPTKASRIMLGVERKIDQLSKAGQRASGRAAPRASWDYAKSLWGKSFENSDIGKENQDRIKSVKSAEIYKNKPSKTQVTE